MSKARSENTALEPVARAARQCVWLGDDVSLLALSTKERKALDLLGIATVGEFLNCDLRPVFELRGFGERTYLRLKASRDALKHSGAIVSTDARIAAAKGPVTNDSWLMLPFFHGAPVKGVTEADLHPSYRPDMSVDRLALPGRAKYGLRPLRLASPVITGIVTSPYDVPQLYPRSRKR